VLRVDVLGENKATQEQGVAVAIDKYDFMSEE
jgi:hypothetical protein